jgi:hypothetical protein
MFDKRHPECSPEEVAQAVVKTFKAPGDHLASLRMKKKACAPAR